MAARVPLEVGEGLVLVGAGILSGSVTAASGQNRSRGSPLGRPTGREAPRRFLAEPRPPLVLLADVGLDDADGPDRERIGRHARGGQQPQEDDRAEDRDRGSQLRAVVEPQRAAEQDDQRRQAVGADQRAGREQRRIGERPRRGVPRKAGEHRRRAAIRSSPRRRRSASTSGTGRRGRSARRGPRPARINGEVERQQHDRDPAEPRRHVGLIGKGGRDPVERDDELAEAEHPAERSARRSDFRATAIRTGRRRRPQQRPPVDRLEGEGRRAPGRPAFRTDFMRMASGYGALTKASTTSIASPGSQ